MIFVHAQQVIIQLKLWGDVVSPVVKLGKIGTRQITVPDAFFKALLVYIDESYHGIAFVMLNNPTTQRLPDSYMSINDLEKISGLDFFPSLDDSIEEIVEDNVDLKFWNIR